jgi:hypothetical protein
MFIIELPQNECARVAQLDRVSGYEPEGREFESLRAHHFFFFSLSFFSIFFFGISFPTSGTLN